jgi:hypothetical protein
MTTLADIQAVYNKDSEMYKRKAFIAVDLLARDESVDIKERAEALRWLSDTVMNCGREEGLTDDQLVSSYLVELDHSTIQYGAVVFTA